MTADLKSLIHGMSAAQVATAQAAHDARQPEIDALRRERDELVKALAVFSEWARQVANRHKDIPQGVRLAASRLHDQAGATLSRVQEGR